MVLFLEVEDVLFAVDIGKRTFLSRVVVLVFFVFRAKMFVDVSCEGNRHELVQCWDFISGSRIIYINGVSFLSRNGVCRLVISLES
jgi:hypothetical protein